MAVDKFYAIYIDENGTGEIVDVYQAIKMVYQDAIIVTKPKEKGSLYDIETYLKVLPRRGVNPHFRYYSDEDSLLKGKKSILEYTPELKTFIKAFEDIRSFKIEEWEKDPITIIPKNMQKLRRIETKDSFVVLKFLVELKETKPYSYYYKYNGALGLEFSVTSQPEPIKRKELGEQGIPLFRSNIQFPSWIPIPTEIEDELQFESIAAEIKNTYQNRNYRLQGEFINQAVNFPDYKEKYKTLNEFERQCDELKKEKEQYERSIAIQKEKLASLEAEKVKQQTLIKEECQLLEEYRSEIDHYEKLKDDNKKLNFENSHLAEQKEILIQNLASENNDLQKAKEEATRLKIENSILTDQKEDLENNLKEAKNQLNDATNQLHGMKNKGFFKNIFSKKSK